MPKTSLNMYLKTSAATIAGTMYGKSTNPRAIVWPRSPAFKRSAIAIPSSVWIGPHDASPERRADIGVAEDPCVVFQGGPRARSTGEVEMEEAVVRSDREWIDREQG